MIAGQSWVDIALLAVLGLSAVIGLWRGLVYELMSLAGWVVAYVVAQHYGTSVATWLPVGEAGSTLRALLSYATTFAAMLLVWTLLAKLARAMISATPLSVVDRALGAGFGLARGLFILLVAALVVTATPASRSAAWQSSRGAAWLSALLHGVKPALPADLGRHLDA
jgi:membrane protein required for colicin V production